MSGLNIELETNKVCRNQNGNSNTKVTFIIYFYLFALKAILYSKYKYRAIWGLWSGILPMYRNEIKIDLLWSVLYVFYASFITLSCKDIAQIKKYRQSAIIVVS